MKKTLLALSMIAMLSGCATIVKGKTQVVSVETTPAGATCKLTNDEGVYWIQKTPGTVTVGRDCDPLHVECELGGKVNLSQATTTHNWWVAGNVPFMFLGAVFCAVDGATGATCDYPEVIKVDLTKVDVQVAS